MIDARDIMFAWAEEPAIPLHELQLHDRTEEEKRYRMEGVRVRCGRILGEVLIRRAVYQKVVDGPEERPIRIVHRFTVPIIADPGATYTMAEQLAEARQAGYQAAISVMERFAAETRGANPHMASHIEIAIASLKG